MDIAKQFQELLGAIPEDQIESLMTELKNSPQMAHLCKDMVINRAMYRAGVLTLDQVMGKNVDELESAIAAHLAMLSSIKSGESDYMRHIEAFITEEP